MSKRKIEPNAQDLSRIAGFSSMHRAVVDGRQRSAIRTAEACLAHAVANAVVQAYQRSSMLERRRPIMAAWASFLSGETGSNVLPMKREVA
jgi:hypothetical protein